MVDEGPVTGRDERMASWHEELLERCCNQAEGVAIGEGAFGPGPALWVGKREVAHFDDERTLDVRLTKAGIRLRRDELRADDRITLRKSSSDWLELTVKTDDDVEWASLRRSRLRRRQPGDRT